MCAEYRKNKATFHSSPPASGSPYLTPVPPGAAPTRQWLVNSVGRLAGRPPRATRSACRVAGASPWHWGFKRLGWLSWDGGTPLAHAASGRVLPSPRPPSRRCAVGKDSAQVDCIPYCFNLAIIQGKRVSVSAQGITGADGVDITHQVTISSGTTSVGCTMPG